MASNSGRRSGSSGASRDRRSIYISGRDRDRALSQAREEAEQEPEARRAARGRRWSPPRRRQRHSEDEGSGAAQSAARRAAEAKRTERETRKAVRSRAARLRALTAALAAVVTLGSCVAIYRSALFTVTRVEVEGTVYLSAKRVRELARVPADATLLRFPADVVSDRVGADPWVRSVTVSRVFPDGMRIRVVERRPVGMVDAGAKYWLVDGSGTIIAQRSAEQTATFIVIRDVPGLDPKAGRKTSSEPLLNAVKALTGLSPTIVSGVTSVSAPTVDGTTLFTADKVEIVVGQAVELAKKSELVLTILKEQRGKVVSIDVRTTDRPTWRGLPQQ